MCYGIFIVSSNENSEDVGCKREYQRWHIVQEMKQCSEIPVCNFNLLHLVAGSGHLRSSPENILCSRITSLLHFHHQQELLGDVIQVQQWQTLRNPFRAPVFYRRCVQPISSLTSPPVLQVSFHLQVCVMRTHNERCYFVEQDMAYIYPPYVWLVCRLIHVPL